MSIGSRIKAAREAREWTQFQLGVVMGKRDTDVSRYERENLMPRADVVILLARALGVSSDYLLGLKKDMDLDPAWIDHAASGPLLALEQLPPAPTEAPARQPRRSRRG
jgi:transcriptional regulator with XRE-family HTH domain